MATWTTLYSINDGGTPVVYQRETSPPESSGDGEGNRHRLLENGIEYDPAPMSRPCRSPNYMAASWDPFHTLDYGYAGTARPRVLRVVDITP